MKLAGCRAGWRDLPRSQLEPAAFGCDPPSGSVVVFPRTWSHCRRAKPAGIAAEGEHDETRQDGVGRRASGCQPLREFRRALLSEGYSDHLDKPLAYWALPADRRLPLALLGRTLDNILNTPFVDLSATPGIGRKKIASLVVLLARAANTDPAELPTDVLSLQDGTPRQADAEGNDANGNGFDPAAVSEVSWAQWRASIVRHGLSGETLGRFAPACKT